MFRIALKTFKLGSLIVCWEVVKLLPHRFSSTNARRVNSSRNKRKPSQPSSLPSTMNYIEDFKLRAFRNLRRAQWNFLGWQNTPTSPTLAYYRAARDHHWLGNIGSTPKLNNDDSGADRIQQNVEPATKAAQGGGQTAKILANTERRAQEKILRVARCKKPKTFSRFADLPAEIRIKIWKLNLPAPRSLTIHPDFLSEDFHGQSVLSPLFDACFESNEVMTKAYPLCFEVQLLGNGLRFSPDRDTIIFPGKSRIFLESLHWVKQEANSSFYVTDYRIMKDFSPQSWFGYAELTPSEGQGYKLVKHLIVRYDFLLGVVLPFVERFENLATLVVEGMTAVDPTWRSLAVDEQSFMARLRFLALERGNKGSMPLVTFRIAQQ
ncbi:hypothetical protein VTL71DRAFT_8965 [Oculimacula yallundae]|uniref:2EXR domain-containing protein n=1 Tax=Oculimacula yallundae TaxID=86028 RepID=A0ABR4BTD7_9HELO